MKNRVKKFAALLLAMVMLGTSMAIPALASAGVSVTDVMKNDQKVITNVTVEVTGTTEKAGKGIIAVYTKKDSTLKKVFFSKTNLEKGSTEGKYTLDFEDKDLKVGEDEEMRVFVWAMDDEKGLTQQPLSDTYTYEEPKELPSTAIIGTLAANEKMFPQDEITIGDMAENLVFTPNTEDESKINVSGTIKYVESYTSIDEQYQTHYYLPVKVSGLNKDAVVYLGYQDGYEYEQEDENVTIIDGKKYIKITSDHFDAEETEFRFINRIGDEKQAITVMVDLDGDKRDYVPTTYTIDVSALTLAEKPAAASTASMCTLGAETALYEKTAAELAENLALTPNTEDASKIDVSGTLKYVENYPSMGDKAQTHYYLPFAVSGLNENTVVYLESKEGFTDTINEKTYKKITSANFDDDAKSLLYIVRAVDNDKKSFTVIVDLDGDGKEYAPTTYTFDLSELALEQVYNVTGIADKNISAVKLYQNDAVVASAEPKQGEDGTYTVTFPKLKAGEYAISAEVKSDENVEYVIDYIKVGGEETRTVNVVDGDVSFEVKSKEKTYTVSGTFTDVYGAVNYIAAVKLTNTATDGEIMGTVDYDTRTIVFSDVPNGTYSVNVLCNNKGLDDNYRNYYFAYELTSASYENGVLTVNKTDVSDLKVGISECSPAPGDSSGGAISLTGTASAGVEKVLLMDSGVVALTGTPSEQPDDNGKYTLTFDEEVIAGYTYTVVAVCTDGYVARIKNNSYANGKIYVRKLPRALHDTDAITVTAAAPADENLTVTNTAKEADKDTNNGYVDVRENAQAGACVKLTVNPNENYVTKSVAVTSGEDAVSLIQLDDNTYMFTMPDKDVTVSAEFERVYSITAETVEGAEISFWKDNGGTDDPTTSAAAGETVYVQVNVTDTNEEVGKVQYSADGENYTEAVYDENSRYYVFTMPASDVTVRALLMS